MAEMYIEMKQKSIAFSISFDFRVLLANNPFGLPCTPVRVQFVVYPKAYRRSLREIYGDSSAKISSSTLH